MLSHVNIKQISNSKLFPTQFTIVRFIACVNSFMIFQFFIHCKLFATMLAYERFLDISHVPGFMAFEAGTCWKPGRTFTAQVILFTLVNCSVVKPPGSATCQPNTANFTMSRFLRFLVTLFRVVCNNFRFIGIIATSQGGFHCSIFSTLSAQKLSNNYCRNLFCLKSWDWVAAALRSVNTCTPRIWMSSKTGFFSNKIPSVGTLHNKNEAYSHFGETM